MIGALGVEEVQGLPASHPALTTPEPGERTCPCTASRPGSQVCCFTQMLEVASNACLRSPSKEPGFLFCQSLPDVFRSLTGGDTIVFTSKATSFPDCPDSACFTSFVTDTALHINSQPGFRETQISNEFIFLMQLQFNFPVCRQARGTSICYLHSNFPFPY